MENNYTRIYDINTKPKKAGFFKDLFSGPAGIFLLIMFAILVIHGIVSFVSSIKLTNIIPSLIAIPAIILSLTIHEYSHAKMADFLGDPTPRRMGRLTLNPLKHLDIWGTLLLIFANFGWAKPVEVNPNNCKNPKKAMMSIALAGPISNMILAILGVLIYKLIHNNKPIIAAWSNEFFYIILTYFFMYFAKINLVLMFFNLIPLTPLDGSRILKYFVPAKNMYQYSFLEANGPFLLILLMLFGGLDKYLELIVSNSFSFISSLI